MSLLVKLLREGLGRVIVFIDWLSRPRKLKRSDEAQASVQAESRALALYQYYACPFCIRTRRAMHKLNIPIETRDVRKRSDYREELGTQGGHIKVPCLRIEDAGKVRWMYESKDIIQYLNQRFGAEVA